MASRSCLAGLRAAAPWRVQAAPRALLACPTTVHLGLGAPRVGPATPAPLGQPRLGLPPLRRRCRRSLTTAAAAQRPAVELLLDAIPGSEEVLSARLVPEVRERTERAIKARGRRVTIGDVASTAGLPLRDAEAALRALAADAQATLQVADDGEVVYMFPRGFEDAIRAKSLLLRAEPALKGAKAGLEYLLRVAFGTALIVSVVAVFAAITVISSSSSNDNRREQRGGGGGYYGGGPRFMFDMTDLLWYWDPFYSRNRRARLAQEAAEGREMNFLEAIFSWVFGDGDPNADYDRRRWQAAGRYIQSRGGTVVAEELAPFLDLKPGQLASDRGRLTVDESYVLPALARFNGTPTVDAAGNLTYTFPELQQTATARQRPAAAAPLEQRWELTAASPGQKLAAIALGAANLVGVLVLSSMLADPYNKMALARNGLLWVASTMPFLQAYAAAFFAVPLWRWFANQATNAAIDARNAAREAALRLLQRPDATLAQKLAVAAQGQRQRVVTERDVVYSSDRPLEQQPVDLEAAGFEERLRRREEERQRQTGRLPPPPQRQPPPAEAPLWWQQQQERQRQQRDR